MNRRGFLKALAVVPLAAVIPRKGKDSAGEIINRVHRENMRGLRAHLDANPEIDRLINPPMTMGKLEANGTYSVSINAGDVNFIDASKVTPLPTVSWRAFNTGLTK